MVQPVHPKLLVVPLGASSSAGVSACCLMDAFMSGRGCPRMNYLWAMSVRVCGAHLLANLDLLDCIVKDQ